MCFRSIISIQSGSGRKHLRLLRGKRANGQHYYSLVDRRFSAVYCGELQYLIDKDSLPSPMKYRGRFFYEIFFDYKIWKATAIP